MNFFSLSLKKFPIPLSRKTTVQKFLFFPSLYFFVTLSILFSLLISLSLPSFFTSLSISMFICRSLSFHLYLSSHLSMLISLCVSVFLLVLFYVPLRALIVFSVMLPENKCYSDSLSLGLPSCPVKNVQNVLFFSDVFSSS